MGFSIEQYREQKRKRLEERLAAGEVIPPPEPWGPRGVLLKQLGFSSYNEYLSSDLWAEIRARILSRDNHICVVCSKRATQVHHRSYRWFVLKGECDADLASMCKGCHFSIEFDTNTGEKRPASKVDGKFRRAVHGESLTLNPQPEERTT